MKKLLLFLLALALANPLAAQDLPANRVVFTDGSRLPVKLDLAVQGLSSKASVRAATTGPITLSGLQTVDGVTLAAGDRVLVKAQAASADNGIRIAATGAWARSTDMDTWSEAAGAFVFVTSGAMNASTGWTTTASSTGTIGTTAMPWVQFSGAGTYTAGNGLSLTGGQFSLAAPVTVANGGTGATSASAARTSLGVAPLDSPALTGTPTAPTAVAGTSTGQLATTSFATTADALRVLKAGDTMTGTLTVPTLAAPLITLPNATDLTLASGAITVTGSRHRVDTEGAAATGDLTTINGGVDGQVLFLSAMNSTRTVIVRSTGNITLSRGDFVLSPTVFTGAIFVYRSANARWNEFSRPAARSGITIYTADAGTTLTAPTTNPTWRAAGTLTASRAVVLSNTGYVAGDTQRLINLTTGGQTLTVRNLTIGGTLLVTLAPAREADVSFDGTNWALDASGSVSTAP